MVLAVAALGACSAPATTAEPEVVTVTATEESVTVVEEPDATVTKTATAKPTQGPSSPSSAPRSTGASSQALTVLNDLPVKGRAPQTGYDRDLFGQAWSDDTDEQYGRNGCDTRIICT